MPAKRRAASTSPVHAGGDELSSTTRSSRRSTSSSRSAGSSSPTIAACPDVTETHFERDLATTTTDSLQLFLNEAGQYPLLTAAEEVELAKLIERGDLQAKDRMINSNLRLVVSIAKKYQGQGLRCST